MIECIIKTPYSKGVLKYEFYLFKLNTNYDKLETEVKEKYFSVVSKYYGSTANKSADDLIDGLALITISQSLNPDLYNILNGSAAYVITLFYSGISLNNRRSQIALSYNSIPTKMAIRIYSSNGWTAWKELALTDSPIFTGTPKAPTATAGTKTTQLATCEFVDNSRCYPSPVSGRGNLPNTNLNYCRTTLIAALSSVDLGYLSNVPSTNPGILRITVAGSYVVQEYFDSNRSIFTRFYNGSSWTTWVTNTTT